MGKLLQDIVLEYEQTQSDSRVQNGQEWGRCTIAAFISRWFMITSFMSDLSSQIMLIMTFREALVERRPKG